MSNIVTNILDFGSGDDAREAFRRMLETVRKDGEELGSISFEKIIPMPGYVRDSMDPDRGGKETPPLWWRWSMRNWGSKWDAIDYCPLDPDQGDHTMVFSTAWTPVEPVITALSKMFPEQTINYRWAENENIGMNVGEMTQRNGETLSSRVPDDFTREAYELSAAILEVDLADHGLYLSANETTYEERESPPIPPRHSPTEHRRDRRGSAR